MAKSSKASRAKAPALMASFTVPMKVEIRQPEFEPLASLAALDVHRLRKGNHKKSGSSKAAAVATSCGPSSGTAW